MNDQETVYSDQNTGVTVLTSVLLPGAAEQCAIREHGRDRLNLMLFGGGAASLFALRAAVVSDSLTEALGRVLAGHSFRHAPPSPALVRDIRAQAEPVCEELAWSDLAVDVCPPRAVGKLACYPLICGDAVALVLATDDQHMPITHVTCTTAGKSAADLRRRCRPMGPPLSRSTPAGQRRPPRGDRHRAQAHHRHSEYRRFHPLWRQYVQPILAARRRAFPAMK